MQKCFFSFVWCSDSSSRSPEPPWCDPKASLLSFRASYPILLVPPPLPRPSPSQDSIRERSASAVRFQKCAGRVGGGEGAERAGGRVFGDDGARERVGPHTPMRCEDSKGRRGRQHLQDPARCGCGTLLSPPRTRRQEDLGAFRRARGEVLEVLRAGEPFLRFEKGPYKPNRRLEVCPLWNPERSSRNKGTRECAVGSDGGG